MNKHHRKMCDWNGEDWASYCLGHEGSDFIDDKTMFPYVYNPYIPDLGCENKTRKTMKYEFGKTKACERLEKMLENNPRAHRRVSMLLSRFSNQMLRVMATRDPEIVNLCMELLKDYTLNLVDKNLTLPSDTRSYLKNIIMYRYRAYRDYFMELDLILDLLDAMEA